MNSLSHYDKISIFNTVSLNIHSLNQLIKLQFVLLSSITVIIIYKRFVWYFLLDTPTNIKTMEGKVEMTRYEEQGLLHEMFQRQARATPDRPAVVTHDGRSVTFKV